ncbi:MAG: MliC family protein [Perlucidibaca sp.]
MKKLCCLLLLSCAGLVPAQDDVAMLFPATPAEALDAGAGDCLRQAETQSRADDPEFIRITFDLPVSAEPAPGPAGRQPLATVYKGGAVYQSQPGSERLQFICLHSGEPGGVVFFDTLPVSVEVADPSRYNQYETWRCDQRGVFPVTYNSLRDQVFLRVDGREQALRHGVSASGARYDNAEVAWWGKGREARLLARDGDGERELDHCRLASVRQP